MNNGCTEGSPYELGRNDDITTIITGLNLVVLKENITRQEPIYTK